MVVVGTGRLTAKGNEDEEEEEENVALMRWMRDV
jgi:hypothetical protein